MRKISFHAKSKMKNVNDEINVIRVASLSAYFKRSGC
jgi:hypothetical protein